MREAERAACRDCQRGPGMTVIVHDNLDMARAQRYCADTLTASYPDLKAIHWHLFTPEDDSDGPAELDAVVLF